MDLNRVCNVEDFADPAVRSAIREVFAYEAARYPGFPQGREHRKYWEVAMTALAFRDGGVLREDAQVLGVGAGAEPTIFWLTNQVGRVFATDLYLAAGQWAPEAHPAMLTDPGRYWPSPWRKRHLVAQHMDALQLEYEDASFDGVFSAGSIEHFGDLDDIAKAAAEMFRVLRPGGTLSLSTEYLLDGSPLQIEGLTMFTPQMLQDLIVAEHDWRLTGTLATTVTAATRASRVGFERVVPDYERHRAERGGETLLHELELRDYPHVVLELAGNVFTSVHIVLRKQGQRRRRPAQLPPAPLVAAGPRAEIAELTGLLPRPLCVVDAGCRWGFGEHWERLREHVRLIGFDPDEAECDRLRRRYGQRLDATLVPLALGAEDGRLEMRRFRSPGGNSFFEHDPLVDELAIPREGDTLDELRTVDIVTLDGWARENAVEAVDAIKLDVQGFEVEILRGAEGILEGVQMVETEVVFNPLMRDAPLFGALDAFLRARGFLLWRLRDLAHYPVVGGQQAPGAVEGQEHFGNPPVRFAAPAGMLSWGNAIYVRRAVIDRESPETWDRHLSNAVLADALRLHDVALVCLRRVLAAAPPPSVAAAVQRVMELTVAPTGEIGVGDLPRSAGAGVASGRVERLARRAARRLRPRVRRVIELAAGSRAGSGAVMERLDELEDTLLESNAYVARALNELRDASPGDDDPA